MLERHSRRTWSWLFTFLQLTSYGILSSKLFCSMHIYICFAATLSNLTARFLGNEPYAYSVSPVMNMLIFYRADQFFVQDFDSQKNGVFSLSFVLIMENERFLKFIRQVSWTLKLDMYARKFLRFVFVIPLLLCTRLSKGLTYIIFSSLQLLLVGRFS